MNRASSPPPRCPSPEQLERFLADELNAADSGIVAEHVNACPSCQQQLERLTGEKPATPTPGAEPESIPLTELLNELRATSSDRPTVVHEQPMLTLASGDQTSEPHSRWPALPDYEILGEIGRGGMGVVYKARQISLHRLVALKMVLAGSGASEMVLSRFRTEAEAVARLQHVNIVQIFAIGEHEGRPYLALELVEGETLAQAINNTPQRPMASAAVVEALARAIHVAHQLGIVHRDLKPSNVLLKRSARPPSVPAESRTNKPARNTPSALSKQIWRNALLTLSPAATLADAPSRVTGHESDDLGVPKITDFGLAKLLDEEMQLTRTGDIMGTPCYMAPEQAMSNTRGSRNKGTVGPAADIYSLGAILYEALTGRPPFKGKTTVETLLQVLHEDPVSPSRLQPRIPQDLTTICLKCLEKEPGKRYHSALALAEDLRRFQKGEPVLARRVGTAGLVWRWARRRPGLAAMAVLLLASLMFGLLGMTTLWLRAEGHRRSAEASTERAESTLYFSRTAQAQLEWRLNDPAATISLLDQCVPKPGEVDRRGWEWYYLRSMTASELLGFSAGSEYVTDLSFSPDGQRLLASGGNPFVKPNTTGSLRVWDVGWGEQGGKLRLVNSLDERSAMLRVVALTRDGRMAAFESADGAVKLWDVQKWEPIRTLAAGEHPILSLSFSLDGQSLVSSDFKGAMTVWDVPTGTARFRLRAGKGKFTIDGTRLITLGRSEQDASGRLVVWDSASGRELAKLPVEGYNVDMSPDGRTVVVWSGMVARVVNLSTGEVVATLANHSGEISDATFSPDGLHVATASADQTARLSDSRTGAEELVFRGHLVRVGSVAFHPSGRYLATADKTGDQVKIWDLSRRLDYATAGGSVGFPNDRQRGYSRRAVAAMQFVPDGKQLIMVRTDGSIVSCDADGGPDLRPAQSVPLTSQWLVPSKVAAFSTDGRRLAGVHLKEKNVVCVWDTSTGQEMLRLDGHTVPVFYVAASRDGKRLATAGFDWKQTNSRRELKVWDATTGALRADFQPTGNPGPRRIHGLAALSSDGALVGFDDYPVQRAADGSLKPGPMRIKVRRVSDGRDLFDLPGHDEVLTALCFSSDGSVLASGSVDGVVQIHQLTHGRSLPPKRFQGPSSFMGSLAFSADNRLLAVADREQVQLWHVPSGEEVIILRGAPPRISDNGFNPFVAWSPDGRKLATFNHDHSVSIWDRDGAGPVRDRFRAAEERAFAWHLAHAQAAIWDPQLRFAAQFHLEALARIEPPNDSLRLDYGTLLVWLGRWRDALDQFTKAHEQHPFEFAGQFRDLGLLRSHVGDHDGWRNMCAHARDHFGHTDDPETAENLTLLCQLASEGAADPEQLAHWSDVAQGRGMPLARKQLLTVGPQYRSGKFREVIQSLENTLPSDEQTFLLSSASAFLAMAHARLGELDEARTWVNRAERLFTEQNRVLGDNPMVVMHRSAVWQEWIEARMLADEAKAVLKAAEALLPSR